MIKWNRINKGETCDRVDRGTKIQIERLKDRHKQWRYQCRIRQKMNRCRKSVGDHGQVEE